MILGTRRHGETSVIVEVMTRAHGRHLGLVRGGRSRKQQPVLQPGNRVELVWRARLDEHLGTFQVEPLTLHAAPADRQRGRPSTACRPWRRICGCCPSATRTSACSRRWLVMLDHLERRRTPRPNWSSASSCCCWKSSASGSTSTRCAATGSRDDLAYVSPKSGRAVSRAAGAPWGEQPSGFALLPDRRCRPPRRRAGRARRGLPADRPFLRPPCLRAARPGAARGADGLPRRPRPLLFGCRQGPDREPDATSTIERLGRGRGRDVRRRDRCRGLARHPAARVAAAVPPAASRARAGGAAQPRPVDAWRCTRRSWRNAPLKRRNAPPK